MSDMIPRPARSTLTEPSARPEAPLFVPRIDVVEEADRFVVRADMPGCDPAAIDIHYERGSLTLRGHVPERKPGGAPRHREYGVGDFLRRFNVTDSIDVEKIAAEYADGVLTLTLPKVEAARPRSIRVQVK